MPDGSIRAYHLRPSIFEPGMIYYTGFEMCREGVDVIAQAGLDILLIILAALSAGMGGAPIPELAI